MKRILIVILLIFQMSHVVAQVDPKWDDTKSKAWSDKCEKIEIISSVDGKIQNAYFFKSIGNKPRPLIISLHTWSSGYKQQDTLSWQSIKGNFNYIHPDFRGPNNTFEACGSPLVISDIDDAIDYAIKNGNVDTNNIHVIGVSGGGYATLLAYMNTKFNVKSFSAWAPLSNLVDWYHESEGRKLKYAKHLAQATTGLKFDDEPYYLNVEEAKKRSPIYMTTPIEMRLKSKLYIYEGVHDGYTGSVPITHSLNIYNKLVKDFDIEEEDAIISKNDIIKLLTYRGFSENLKEKIGERKIHYRKKYNDKLQITIFEGGHEMISDVALNHIESKSILVIGDSNGEMKNGWVDQLKKLRFDDFFYNTSISGNTIGFNNLDDIKKNTLLNVDDYIDSANQNMGSLDAIIIMLGTNDCKNIFNDKLKQVPKKMNALITKIKAHKIYKQHHPKIFIVSPPPIGPDWVLKEKYRGGSKRIEYLIPKFKEISKNEDCIYIDTFSIIRETFENITIDGIHLNIEGQKIIASIIYQELKECNF